MMSFLHIAILAEVAVEEHRNTAKIKEDAAANALNVLCAHLFEVLKINKQTLFTISAYEDIETKIIRFELKPCASFYTQSFPDNERELYRAERAKHGLNPNQTQKAWRFLVMKIVALMATAIISSTVTCEDCLGFEDVLLKFYSIDNTDIRVLSMLENKSWTEEDMREFSSKAFLGYFAGDGYGVRINRINGAEEIMPIRYHCKKYKVHLFICYLFYLGLKTSNNIIKIILMCNGKLVRV
jgi:hypothetical protein